LSLHVHCKLEATPESVAVARGEVTALLARAGVESGVAHDVRLAVCEACSNVVMHAYRGDPGPLEVEAWVDDDDRAVVSVRDEGLGLRPRVDSPGLGLGLSLITALAQRVEMEKRAQGTEVRMTFVLGAGHASAAGR
jgi:serine/threonine-protein kinase RsbW